MFKDIEKKLKIIAQGIAFFGIALSVIFAIILFSASSNSAMMFSGFMVLLFGSVGSWITGVSIYAFGELIEETKKGNQMKKFICREIRDEKKKPGKKEKKQPQETTQSMEILDEIEEDDIEEDFDEV